MSIVLFVLLVVSILAYRNLSSDHEAAVEFYKTFKRKNKELQEQLTSSNHIKKMFKEALDASEEETKALKQQVDRLSQANVGLSKFLEEMNNGVFYDEVNDSIVTMNNLHKIGDL